MRILFIPLDERFCTKDYFLNLASSCGLDVRLPKHLGLKKIPADVDYLRNWLINNAVDCDIAIISLDMLLHGGLVPSRMDYWLEDTLIERLNILSEIKKLNKNLKIYASKSITRIPTYNSSEEEPDYWAYFGKALYEYSLSVASGNDVKPEGLPDWVINDFLWRRKRNLRLTQEAISLVENGIIDFMSVMLDDNSEGSLVYKEARDIQNIVQEKGISERVLIRNGADEALLSLLSKALCDYFKVSPKFKIFFRFQDYAHLIPPYESKPLRISVEDHIFGVGGTISNSDFECDIILYVNNFKEQDPREAVFQTNKEDDGSLERFNNSTDLSIAFSTNSPKIVGYADVRYANGSDNELVRVLLNNDIDWKKTCYYGWNTAGNTIGSTCAHSVLLYLCNLGLLKLNEENLKKYQAILILEHWGYQANIRQALRKELALREPEWNNCLSMIKNEQWAKEFVEKEFQEYLSIVNKTFQSNWKITVFFPWHRTFEIGIELSNE
ncbi:DUF4127 family protein [Fervidobacterium sp.]